MLTKEFYFYSGKVNYNVVIEAYTPDAICKWKPRLKRGDNFNPKIAMLWEVPLNIVIKGWEGSISTFDKVHVRNFLTVYRGKKRIYEPFATINTGDQSLWGKQKPIGKNMFGSEGLEVKKGDIMVLGAWVHNMRWLWFHWSDCHSNYTIYYDIIS